MTAKIIKRKELLATFWDCSDLAMSAVAWFICILLCEVKVLKRAQRAMFIGAAILFLLGLGFTLIGFGFSGKVYTKFAVHDQYINGPGLMLASLVLLLIGIFGYKKFKE